MVFEIENYQTMQMAMETLSRFFAEHGVPSEKAFDCKLVACELVGNVLKYADGKAGLRVEVLDGFARLKALSDSFFGLPERIECSGLYAESGRGLFLVNTLCEGEITAEADGIVAKIKL